MGSGPSGLVGAASFTKNYTEPSVFVSAIVSIDEQDGSIHWKLFKLQASLGT